MAPARMRPAGGGDNIGDAGEIGDDHRRVASHALQQDIGPALTHRGKQQEARRAVDVGKMILRHATEKADAIGDPTLPRQCLDCPRPSRRPGQAEGASEQIGGIHRRLVVARQYVMAPSLRVRRTDATPSFRRSR